MPPLDSAFKTFERVDNFRLSAVEEKERYAANFAKTLLVEEPPLSKPAKAGRLITKLITGKQPAPARRPESALAIYTVEAANGPHLVAAFVTPYCLFTAKVKGTDESGRLQLRELQPQAVLTPGGYLGFPVVPLDKAGYEVFPNSMTLDEREAFVDEVQETLDIIHSQATSPTFSEIPLAPAFAIASRA